MKKIIAAACLLGSSVALSACGNTGMGYVDTQPPYTEERTAGYRAPQTVDVNVEVEKEPVRTATPVFETRVLK